MRFGGVLVIAPLKLRHLVSYACAHELDLRGVTRVPHDDSLHTPGLRPAKRERGHARIEHLNNGVVGPIGTAHETA